MDLLPLVDSFGRHHSNLRISVTDRCNLRCIYCMPAGSVRFLPQQFLLSFEEIERFVRIMAGLGVSKIRLTGGEPLVRSNLPELIRRLHAIPGIEDLGLTTNGILLAEQARSLYDAGLRRLNISLDVLDPANFQEVTRRSGYERVLAGIEAARDIGFDPIKINAVAMQGMTEQELVRFGIFARETGCEVRFIEYMPLDADHAWEQSKVLSAQRIRELLARDLLPLVPLPPASGSPSTDFVFADGLGQIGFIPSVSEPFCDRCHRFRITADGKLRNCLFSLKEYDLRPLLRDFAPDDEIIALVRQAIQEKWAGHQILDPHFEQPDRPMYSIGG